MRHIPIENFLLGMFTFSSCHWWWEIQDYPCTNHDLNATIKGENAMHTRYLSLH